MKQIGRVVRLHRKLSGLSLVQLAEIAGVGKTLLFDIEQGKETVQFAGLKKVLDALNIKIQLESPVMDKLLAQEANPSTAPQLHKKVVKNKANKRDNL